jgi:hypothetical protein
MRAPTPTLKKNPAASDIAGGAKRHFSYELYTEFLDSPQE